METLARGTALDADEIRATGAAAGAPIVIERGLGECPHGFWYEARQDDQSLLLTVLDPILVAQGDVRATLQREVDRARQVAHRNLLRCYGMATAGSRVLLAEAWPAGGTVREFARHRIKNQQPLDAQTAYTLIAHVCNAAAALHEHGVVHGYITPDTVHVSKEGRVLVAAGGVGSCLPRARGFARFRAGGLLPGIAPEQLGTSAQVTPATDVFALAALFIELMTGRGLREPGQPLAELDITDPPALRVLLEDATARESERRPRDGARFKARLSEVLQSAGLRAETRPPPSMDDSPPIVTRSVAPAEAGTDPPEGYPPGHPHGPPLPPDAPLPAPPDAAPGAYPYIDPATGMPMVPPGYPPPGYPPQGYPPQGYPPPGYPPPGYPPQGYPPPGYPPQGYPPQGYAGQPGYPPPGYPGYPGYPPPGYPHPSMPAWPGPPMPGAQPPAAAPGAWATPNPATPPPMTDATQKAMAELDQATKRLAGDDDAYALTTGIDGEDGPPQVGSRDDDEDDDDEEDEDEDDDNDDDDDDDESPSDSSMLGLNLGGYSETAGRLATLDGKADRDERAGPTESGTYFSSFADPESRADMVHVDHDAQFEVVRADKDYGPYDIPTLQRMIRGGRIKSVDTLRNAESGQECLVVDLALLKQACVDFASGEDGDKLQLAGPRPNAPIPPAAIIRGEAPAKSSGGGGAMKLVVALVVLGALGAAGWWVSQNGMPF